MKVTEADFEDHLRKLSEGYKATFNEEVPPYLIQGHCHDLIAVKKSNYIRAYLQTWSPSELQSLVNLVCEKNPPPPPSGLIDNLLATSIGQAAQEIAAKAPTGAKVKSSKPSTPKVQSLDEARINKATRDGEKKK